jgi:hypothetical protein
MTEAELPIQIAKLQLAPDDILVARFTRLVSQETCKRASDHIKRLLPPGVQVLVIDPSIDLSVLTRSEIESRAT